jgi:hypothetical protein
MELSDKQIERIIEALEGINDSLGTLAYGNSEQNMDPLVREISIVSDCLSNIRESVDHVAVNCER